MGDLYSSEFYSSISPTEAYDVLLNYVLPKLHISSYVSSTDGIFSDLLTLTSYITSRIIQFFEDLIINDAIRRFGNSTSVCCNQVERCASGCDYTILGVNQESSSTELPVVDPEFAVVPKNCRYGAANCSVLKGLVLPFSGLRIARRFALTTLMRSLCCLRHAQTLALGFISRAKTTLRGSYDDIGWLHREPGMAPVEDGSARFLELLEQIRNGKHTLPHCFVYLLIPGLFSNHGPLYFVSTKRYFSKMGLTCHIAKIHSEASVEHNALVLKQYIEELYWGSGGKRVMLLGHSKGGVDAAAALSIYQQELVDKIAGLALVQSPYGGTPLASDLLRKGSIADKQTWGVLELIICKLIKGDMQSLEDLTYDKRKEFIRKHKLPENIPVISFHSEASGALGVLARMYPIAHAELSWLPLLLPFDDKYFVEVLRNVPVMLPISAVMALCYIHLRLRYGEKSDGLVTSRDAEVPGSVVIVPDRKLDHGWMVYTSWTKNPSEPDSSQMCEAILTQLVELGTHSKHLNSHP